MTSPPNPLLTRSLARTVDDMLLDAGETDARLRAALLSLGSLRSLPVPEPGPELAAMLLSGPAHELARRRLLRRYRSSVVGLAVIAGMGLGVTGVAASGSVPDGSTNSSVQQMLADWSPAWTITATLVTAPADAGLGEMRAPGSPPTAGNVAGDGAGHPESSGPGINQPGSTGPGASRQETAHQQSSRPAGTGNGKEDNSASKNGDVGAGNSAVGGNSDSAAAEDAASREGREHAGEAGSGGAVSGGAGGQEKPMKAAPLTFIVEEPASSLPQTGKAAAGRADPGLIWLKKFSR